MPKAFVSCDFEFFPDPPYGGQAVSTLDGDMKILVKKLPPNISTAEVRHARDAENYQRTVEWVRAQRLGR
jgi:hypothetical protein